MKKILTVTFLLLIIAACNKEDAIEPLYDVEIKIIQPEDKVYDASKPIPIEIELSRPDKQIIHNVSVEILNTQGEVVDKVFDRHAHVSSEFKIEKQDISLTTGKYSLRVITTDFHGEQPITVHQKFETIFF